MIEIWGQPFNCTYRTLWMLEELDVEHVIRDPYQPGEPLAPHLPVDPAGEVARPEVYAQNPNGKVPVLRDADGTVVWESLAINLYLARKHPDSPLSPRTDAEWAAAYQWSLWAASEADAPLRSRVMLAREGLDAGPPERRAEAETCARALDRPLASLDVHLGRGSHAWLAADRFTVADLNAAAVLSFVQPAEIDLSPYPHLRRWLGRCCGRPPALRVFTRAIQAGNGRGVFGEARFEAPAPAAG